MLRRLTSRLSHHTEEKNVVEEKVSNKNETHILSDYSDFTSSVTDILTDNEEKYGDKYNASEILFKNKDSDVKYFWKHASNQQLSEFFEQCRDNDSGLFESMFPADGEDEELDRRILHFLKYLLDRKDDFIQIHGRKLVTLLAVVIGNHRLLCTAQDVNDIISPVFAHCPLDCLTDNKFILAFSKDPRQRSYPGVFGALLNTFFTRIKSLGCTETELFDFIGLDKTLRLSPCLQRPRYLQSYRRIVNGFLLQTKRKDETPFLKLDLIFKSLENETPRQFLERFKNNAKSPGYLKNSCEGLLRTMEFSEDEQKSLDDDSPAIVKKPNFFTARFAWLLSFVKSPAPEEDESIDDILIIKERIRTPEEQNKSKRFFIETLVSCFFTDDDEDKLLSSPILPAEIDELLENSALPREVRLACDFLKLDMEVQNSQLISLDISPFGEELITYMMRYASRNEIIHCLNELHTISVRVEDERGAEEKQALMCTFVDKLFTAIFYESSKADQNRAIKYEDIVSSSAPSYADCSIVAQRLRRNMVIVHALQLEPRSHHFEFGEARGHREIQRHILDRIEYYNAQLININRDHDYDQSILKIRKLLKELREDRNRLEPFLSSDENHKLDVFSEKYNKLLQCRLIIGQSHIIFNISNKIPVVIEAESQQACTFIACFLKAAFSIFLLLGGGAGAGVLWAYYEPGKFTNIPSVKWTPAQRGALVGGVSTAVILIMVYLLYQVTFYNCCTTSKINSDEGELRAIEDVETSRRPML